ILFENTELDACFISPPVLFFLFIYKQYSKLVIKPPVVTSKVTGFWAKRSDTPPATAASLIGIRALRPRLKHALLTPDNNAINRPFFKAKSLLAFLFSSSLIFFERRLPA